MPFGYSRQMNREFFLTHKSWTCTNINRNKKRMRIANNSYIFSLVFFVPSYHKLLGKKIEKKRGEKAVNSKNSHNKHIHILMFEHSKKWTKRAYIHCECIDNNKIRYMHAYSGLTSEWRRKIDICKNEQDKRFKSTNRQWNNG